MAAAFLRPNAAAAKTQHFGRPHAALIALSNKQPLVVWLSSARKFALVIVAASVCVSKIVLPKRARARDDQKRRFNARVCAGAKRGMQISN